MRCQSIIKCKSSSTDSLVRLASSRLLLGDGLSLLVQALLAVVLGPRCTVVHLACLWVYSGSRIRDSLLCTTSSLLLLLSGLLRGRLLRILLLLL